MFPWATIISLAGQGVSQALSAKNNADARNAANAEAARSAAHYEAMASENPLNNSAARAAINSYDRNAQRQVQIATNQSKVLGYTPEYALGVQEAAQKGRADLLSGVAAGASERQDQYRDKAETVRQQHAADEQARRAARQQQYANLAANAASAFGQIMGAYQKQRTSPAPSNTEQLVDQATDVFTPEQQRHLEEAKKRAGIGFEQPLFA